MAGSLHYINVVPFFANDIAYMVREARRVADRTGLKEIAYSLSLHPEGTPARPISCGWRKRRITRPCG